MFVYENFFTYAVLCKECSTISECATVSGDVFIFRANTRVLHYIDICKNSRFVR